MADHLEWCEVDVAGNDFTAIWDPRDGAVLAGGFAPGRGELMSRLAKLDRASASRGLAERPTRGGLVPEALSQYDAGALGALDRLSVRQPGSEFQQRVWQALREVQAGTVATYTELAGRIGNEKAVRACASVCARNLVALIVPCHRIVRSDGGLGGYLFGLPVKEELLTHEGAIAPMLPI